MGTAYEDEMYWTAREDLKDEAMTAIAQIRAGKPDEAIVTLERAFLPAWEDTAACEARYREVMGPRACRASTGGGMTDDTTNCLYDEYKSLEQSYMSLMDDYSDVARALGFSGSGFWGDVSNPHHAILARARACKSAYDVIIVRKDAA